MAGTAGGRDARTDVADNARRAWIRPQLARLAARNATFGSGVALDGDFMFS